MRELNVIYTVGDGFYKGEEILLKWINNSKTITIGKRRYTQAHGTLLKNKKNINVILEFLRSHEIVDYSSMSLVNLIRKIKSKDNKAKKEFILRYKRVPKF